MAIIRKGHMEEQELGNWKRNGGFLSHVLCIQGHTEEQEIEVKWKLEIENRKTETEMEIQPLCCHSFACYICILEAFCSYMSKFFITCFTSLASFSGLQHFCVYLHTITVANTGVGKGWEQGYHAKELVK